MQNVLFQLYFGQKLTDAAVAWSFLRQLSFLHVFRHVKRSNGRVKMRTVNVSAMTVFNSEHFNLFVNVTDVGE